MKKIILNNKLLRTLVLASGIILSTFNTQASVILDFSETNINVSVNDSFSVDLFAETETASDAFLGFSTGLSFDNSLLNFDGFSLGSDFSEDVFSADIAGIFNADFSDIFSPVLTASGDNILLASLTFTAIEAGTATLASITESFSALLPFQTISVDSAFADISITDASVVDVPAPTTLGVFGISLLLMMKLRRKA